ncbi:unnamed protein product [Adineta steineri]|uniref:Uncharacterized protein n=1 Tax=Adineta steineri TaxID=433720 RepID=A0A814J2Q8_9BILA|nr:unnamed protein product [Adineta steineri]CAF1068286.1 unnamed protein product [Adineta steineri]
MASKHITKNNNYTTVRKNTDAGKRSTTTGATSIMNKSNKDNTQLKATSTVTNMDPPTKTDMYNLQSAEDIYYPSIQSTQLNKQNELVAVPYTDRLLDIMKKHGLICKPTREGHQLTLHVENPDTELIICTGVSEDEQVSEACKCNKYFPPQFEILGNICNFCNHSFRFHRVKPELEHIEFDDMKSETKRNDYKYWFDKFIELQRLYCCATKNFSFDNNLFIKIYGKPRQAALSFIQSPNYRYVLIKYVYDGVYDEGETLIETKYQIISLQTMQPIKTDDQLQHSCSYYRDNTQTDTGFRTILWDLNQPATLIATEVFSDRSYQTFVKRIVNIQCPSIDQK